MRAGWTGPLILAGSIVAAAFWQPTPCQAWYWRDAPIDLRIGLAFDRQASTFTDVVGLSASGAYPYGSSVNPASDDLVRTPPNDFTLAGTGTLFYIPFARGASVTAEAASVSGRLPGAGTVTASYSRTESHDARSAQGDTYELDSHDVTIGYSHLVLPWLALGGEFKITDSVLKFGSSALGFPVDTTTESLGYDARAGVVFAPQKNWLIGLMGGAGWSYARTEGAVLIPDAFGGPIPVRFDTFTRSVNIRAGAGWRPSETFGAYVDWQYLRLWTDEDSVTVGRSFAGIEYLPIEALALRVGGSIDTAGKTNVSAGIGFYGLKHALFEFAYVYNAFPELRREFGGAHLLSASIVLYY